MSLLRSRQQFSTRPKKGSFSNAPTIWLRDGFLSIEPLFERITPPNDFLK